MDAVEDIKSRLNIEDVIGEYVHLKRSGRNFKGLSPFSNEKTPSFMVSPEKQIWHDFSSGKGGNMFSFVMEMEGLDFKGALEMLARKAGIDLSQYRSGTGSQREELKKKLHEILELATKFYQIQFSKNQTALEYVFKNRKLNKETALKFKIGYAPEGPAALTTFLLTKNYKLDEIKAAGLSSQRGRDPVDMFRGRLMIPLMDSFGQVIGFTARILKDDPNAPKYINTPQTLLFDKSRHVFGLHLAKEAIRKAKFAVVVEGNMDVIASHQANVNNAVATAGTAMTEMHLKTLGRLTSDVRLAFDQDTAGQAAAERTIPIAAKTGVNLSVITIPAGKDPDELIQKDPKLWAESTEKHDYALDWLIKRYQKSLDLTSAQGKKQFSDILLGVIGRLSDKVEQEHYTQKIAGILDVSVDALLSKLGKTTSLVLRKTPKKEDLVPLQNPEALKAQNQLLAIALMKPAARQFIEKLKPQMLIEENAKKLLGILQKNPEKSIKEVVKDKNLQALHLDGAQGAGEERSETYQVYGEQVPEPATQRSAKSTGSMPGFAGQQAGAVQSLNEYGKMLELQFEELYGDVDDSELRYEAARQLTRLIENYVKTRKKILAAQFETATEDRTRQLLEEVKVLDALLNEFKTGEPR